MPKIIIGKGNNTNFWNDHWLNIPLRSQFIGPLQKNEENRKLESIISVINNNRSWDVRKLPFSLPNNITLQIASKPLSQKNNPLEDTLSWTLTENGSFTTKTAYLKIIQRSESPSNTPLTITTHTTTSQTTTTFTYSWLWKNKAHPRENLFIWQSYLKGLPINKSLKKRLNHISDICPLCNSSPESHAHILKDCPITMHLWESLNPPQDFFNMVYKIWILTNAQTPKLAMILSLGTHYLLMLLDIFGLLEIKKMLSK